MEKEQMISLLEAHGHVSHVDMIHLLEKDCCSVLFADPDIGIALRHPCGTVYAAEFSSEIAPLARAVEDAVLLNSEGRLLAEYFMKGKGWEFKEECWTYRYDPAKGYLDEGPWHHRLMDEGDLPVLRKHYGGVPEDSLLGYIERKDVYALLDGNGNIMGFAGFHPEGSMGLLEIFPEYRRRGLGTAMESFVINEAMRRGSVPFCNVYVSNDASIMLQRDLGLDRGDIMSWWVWPPYCRS